MDWWKDIKHFKKEEFDCACCGRCEMIYSFVQWLDTMREVCGEALHVNSGYRCPTYNALVGGVPNSAHTKGLAVDISTTSSRKRYTVVRAAILCGAKRIFIGENFVHIDLDIDKAQGMLGLY